MVCNTSAPHNSSDVELSMFHESEQVANVGVSVEIDTDMLLFSY